MESINYEVFDELEVKTFTKEAKNVPSGLLVSSWTVSTKLDQPYILKTNDEIPFIFYYKEKKLFGMAPISKDDSIAETLYKKMHETIVQYALDPKKIYCYLGPSLTFSHTLVDRPLIKELMDKGYRLAAKRTDGVDFFDVPMMNVAQLRNLSIPFENIMIDAHDTYECDSLLMSKLRGDNEKNVTLIELR